MILSSAARRNVKAATPVATRRRMFTLRRPGGRRPGAAGTTDRARRARSVVREARPDVLLLDIRMPEVDGLTVLRQVGTLTAPPAVAMLTTFDAGRHVDDALRSDASATVLGSESRKNTAIGAVNATRTRAIGAFSR
ncbi:response regulator [Streptomyces fimicarius]|uniref:response regulator n=1 Tax=Streptomyces griseus TaxID=1911 RepID=UPI00369A5BD5